MEITENEEFLIKRLQKEDIALFYEKSDPILEKLNECLADTVSEEHRGNIAMICVDGKLQFQLIRAIKPKDNPEAKWM